MGRRVRTFLTFVRVEEYAEGQLVERSYSTKCLERELELNERPAAEGDALSIEKFGVPAEGLP